MATAVGGLSGFVGGRLDLVTQRFVDAWMAFPGLLLLMTIMSILGTGAPQIIIVLGLTYGIGSSRVIRGAVIGVKENAYFQAAQAVGSPSWRTVLRHVLPNVLAPIIIIFSVTVGAVIITEASLSFLGFGLPLNVPSWGGLLSREGAQLHAAGAVAGHVAGHLPDHRGVQLQHVRRRGARPAGPAAAWRHRPLLRPPPHAAPQALKEAFIRVRPSSLAAGRGRRWVNHDDL